MKLSIRSFLQKEDFPSGGYNIEKSNAAMSLMKIIKNAFEGDFSKYLAEGKQVKVIITGSADASPIRGRIAYDGRYGEFTDEPYYKDGNLDNITVTKSSVLPRMNSWRCCVPPEYTAISKRM